jgi:HlyD family secretion protein
MPLETFIKTDDRTILSYFTKPFMDHLSRSFREK